MDFEKIIARETGIPLGKVQQTVELLDDGNTVPFIARYRKEATGELDEVQIRLVEDRIGFHRALQARKEDVIRLIQEQGKLSDELQQKIMTAEKAKDVEDLYLPYRQKRKTRAGTARERGLAPLADYLLQLPAKGDPLAEGEKFISDQVPDAAAALQGAMDIVAETVAEDAAVRRWLRDYTLRTGVLAVRAKDPAKDSVYRMYYDNYREGAARMAPHRILAVNRGEREDLLQVGLEVDEGFVLSWLRQRFLKKGVTVPWVDKALTDAYRRLLAPAMERETRSELTERAAGQAMEIFAKNLRALLLQAPVRGRVVLGLDPAYRTGCKWAVIDSNGRLLEVGVIYPTPPHNKVAAAEEELSRLQRQYAFQAVVIGNGTASRETESFVADWIKKSGRQDLGYTIVSEAGASVYSASPLAAAEFPKLDVSQRSAVSIGRRIQDPLAELVKIPPQSAGVGQYQHDLPEKQLTEKLGQVVESVVNYVGVDLNTASAALLGYVAGINGTVAGNIVSCREENGPFRDRGQLKKVPKLGPKTYQQCAGFLRVSHGANPLDNTGIHPESYPAAGQLLKKLAIAPEKLTQPAAAEKISRLRQDEEATAAMAGDLGIGLPTLLDILDNLLRPGRDPREDLPPPVFRADVLKIEDLQAGMVLQGRVGNVTDFGAFVDIGVKQDGLVHISELGKKFIRHPLEAVSIGDVVTVRVLAVDAERGRISLTMRDAGMGEKGGN